MEKSNNLPQQLLFHLHQAIYTMHTAAYLQRINFTAPLTPDLATLQALQRQHLLHIAFENLDIHQNVEIRLELDRIYHKVIENGRGGFCYELNGLFYELLLALGYQARRISAQVYDEKKGLGPKFDHLATIVTLEGQEYLTDVGFGNFTAEPLAFQLDVPQQDPQGVFKISQHAAYIFDVLKLEDGQEKLQYRLDSRERDYQEFAPMCHYMQTSPDSHFTQKRLASLSRPDGRVTLTGNVLKITKNGEVETRELASEADFDAALAKYFGMRL